MGCVGYSGRRSWGAIHVDFPRKEGALSLRKQCHPIPDLNKKYKQSYLSWEMFIEHIHTYPPPPSARPSSTERAYREDPGFRNIFLGHFTKNICYFF